MSVQEILTDRRSQAAPLRTLAEFLTEYDDRVTVGAVAGPRYRIDYATMGSGPPIVIVPGITSPRRSMAMLMVELSRSFQAIVYELAGMTDGDGVQWANYTLDNYADDLYVLAEHLGLGQFSVMGHSFGVGNSIRAMARGDRIGKSMLVGGFAHRPLLTRERIILKIFRHWPGRLRNIPCVRLVSRFNHQRELDLREKALINFMLDQSGLTPIQTVANQVLGVDATDVRDLARTVRQPVLIVHGENDRLVPTRHSAELSRHLPNVQVMLIPQCGHIVHLSHPELLAHAAERFILGKTS